MRLLAVTLAGLILLIQYPLWLGKGGLLRVWETERKIELQQETNRRLQARNAALDAEVLDLKQGLEAVEERARNELGMVAIFTRLTRAFAESRTTGKVTGCFSRKVSMSDAFLSRFTARMTTPFAAN